MNHRLKAMDAVQVRLDYQFKDKALLDVALTHASVAEGARKVADNERLEFLGDRVLGLMVAELLMEQFKEANEGDLSKRFHSLVAREACADIARQLGLGMALKLAIGESKSGGRDNPTILGDACEALIAAVYLDGGANAVKAAFSPLWLQKIDSLGPVAAANPKSCVQEWAAQKKLSAPVYSLIKRTGPDHAPVFTIELIIEGLVPERAHGRSRQEAEKAAALRFMQREGLLT
jgi:ribonuclease III